MKKSQIIELTTGSHRFKIKYSTLCNLRELGVDLMTEKGQEALQSDPNQLRLVFWKGYETGELRKIEKEEAFNIFDEVMEELGPEEFASIIPKALAIKSRNPQEEGK